MTADNREEFDTNRPCMILAHGDGVYAAQLGRAFRRLGWDVYEARSGPEARRLARMLGPELMVLGTDLAVESGWLTCDKVTREMPEVKVVLVGSAAEARAEEFASFVGAISLVDRREPVTTLVEEVCGNALPVAS